MALTKTITIGETEYDFPTKTSELTNDAGFITEGGGAEVITINNATTEQLAEIAKSVINKTEKMYKLYYYDGTTTYELYNPWVRGTQWVYFAVKVYGNNSNNAIHIYTSSVAISTEGKYEADGVSIAYIFDKTITLSQNGNEYSFTTNQSTDKTITLPTIPTKVSDLDNDTATETWTFTLEDGTTVNKTIFIKE